MSIKEDLEGAAAQAALLVTVKQAVHDLAHASGVTDQEAAQWLALKGVHQRVPGYLLHPLKYADELPLSRDEAGVLHYQKIYDALLAIVYPPSGLQLLMDSLAQPGKPPAPRAAWVASEVEAFVIEHGGKSDAVHGRHPDGAIDEAVRAVGDTGIRKVRTDKLLAALRARCDDLLAIPMSTKSEVRHALCATDPRTFTVATFNAAWSELSTGGFLAIEGKAIYAGGAKPRTSD